MIPHHEINFNSLVLRDVKATYVKSILIHEYQLKSTRVYTSQHKSDKINTSLHGSTRVWHKSISIEQRQKFAIQMDKSNSQINATVFTLAKAYGSYSAVFSKILEIFLIFQS